MISQTWIDPDLIDEFNINSYDAYHVTRGIRMGGGVAIYTNKKLPCKMVETKSIAVENILECVTVELSIKKHTNVVVSCMYRTPWCTYSCMYRTPWCTYSCMYRTPWCTYSCMYTTPWFTYSCMYTTPGSNLDTFYENIEHILSDAKSIKTIFACGDVNTDLLKRVIIVLINS